MRAVLVPHSAIPDDQKGHVEGDPDAVVAAARRPAGRRRRLERQRLSRCRVLGASALLLCLAAAFAGWIDAVSGGGGLVQLPALLLLLPGRLARGRCSPPTRSSSVCGTAVVRGDLLAAGAARPAHRPADGRRRAGRRGCGGAVRVAAAGRGLPAARAGAARGGGDLHGLPGPGSADEQRCAGRPHATTWRRPPAGASIGFYDGIFGPGTGALPGLPARRPARLLVPARPRPRPGSSTSPPTSARCWCSSRRARRCGGSGSRWGPATSAGGWLGAHTAIRRGSGFVRVVFLVRRRRAGPPARLRRAARHQLSRNHGLHTAKLPANPASSKGTAFDILVN